MLIILSSYPKLAFTVLFVACYLSMGFDNKLMLFYAMVVIGVILIVVDSIDFKIPVILLIPFLMVAITYHVFIDQAFYKALYGGAIGLFLGFATLKIYKIFKPKIHLDFNNYVKLLGIAGVWLGVEYFIVFLPITGIIIILWSIIQPSSLRTGAIITSILLLMVITVNSS